MTFLPSSTRSHMAHTICKDMQARSCITVRTAAADAVLVVLNSLCGFSGSFGLWPATTWPLSADAGTTTGRCSSASWHTTSSNLPGPNTRHASSSPAAAHGASHGKHGQRHRAQSGWCPFTPHATGAHQAGRPGPRGFTGAAHHACAVTSNEGNVACYAWRIDTSPTFATSAAATAAGSFAAWPADAWYAAFQLYMDHNMHRVRNLYQTDDSVHITYQL